METLVQAESDEKSNAHGKFVKMRLPGIRRALS